MAPATEEKGDMPVLTASYSAPNASKTFEHPLPAIDTSSAEGKAEYLSALRGSVTNLQDQINTFLTGKMEEDKALAAAAGQKIDDKKEEERYGEEGEEEEG
ncbi:hypothetical protein G7Y79_00053g088350 [Physcia stellaris]|nr:hypothetical protein G7Y79_00053g088350 [Physcia stellaris]